MGFRLIEGFDLYNGAGANGVAMKWVFGGSGSSYMAAGRFGGQGLVLDSSSGAGRQAYRSLGPEFAEGNLGIALHPQGSLHGDFMAIRSNVSHLTFRADALGVLTINGPGGTLAASDPGAINESVWNYLECEFVISDTLGRLKTWVNGNLLFDTPANLDTRNGTGLASVLMLTQNAGGPQFLYDDIYVRDTAVRLGERKVQVLRPTADVAVNFTPLSVGDNYLMVDDITQDIDATYVSTDVIGHLDTYEFEDIEDNPAFIDAIIMSCIGRKDDAGTRELAMQVISGASTTDGTSLALSSSYSKLERLLETNPNGGGAWNVAAVNALRGGPKVIV